MRTTHTDLSLNQILLQIFVCFFFQYEWDFEFVSNIDQFHEIMLTSLIVSKNPSKTIYDSLQNNKSTQNAILMNIDRFPNVYK